MHLKDINGQTALDAAIGLKQPAVEAVLRAHLEADAKVAGKGKEEKRKQLGEALFKASVRGDLPEVRRLVALGADARYEVEEGENKGLFPLFVASDMGHVDVIEALVAGGADPNQVEGKFSASSLYVAAQYNQPRAIAALVRAGADVNLATS